MKKLISGLGFLAFLITSNTSLLQAEGPKAIAVIAEKSVDLRKPESQPFSILTQASAEKVLKGADRLSLATATELLQEVGYAPGKIVGFDESFAKRFGDHGGTRLQAAALILGGREKSVEGIVEPPPAKLEDVESQARMNPIKRAKATLQRLIQSHGQESPEVKAQERRIQEIETTIQSRVFYVDMPLFIRNLEQRRGEVFRSKDENLWEVFLDLLKGAGVNADQDYLEASVNQKTSSVIVWNTPEGLDAAERVVLELNQVDDDHAVYMPPISKTRINIEARLFKVTQGDFDRLNLGKGLHSANSVGTFWSLPADEFKAVGDQVAKFKSAKLISAPRSTCSPGISWSLYVGDTERNIECGGFGSVRGEIIDLNFIAHTTGYFGSTSKSDWFDSGGWTNVALMNRISCMNGSGGVVLQARHGESHNLIVLLTGSLKPGKSD